VTGSSILVDTAQPDIPAIWVEKAYKY